jgi:hypothetical protein
VHTVLISLYAMENTSEQNNMTLKDQAEILATRWMSVGQLEEAGELNGLFSGAMLDYMQSGISFRRGPFAKNEKRMIDDALQRYQKVCGLFEADIQF